MLGGEIGFRGKGWRREIGGSEVFLLVLWIVLRFFIGFE